MHFIVATLMVLTNLAEVVAFNGARHATCRFDFVGIVDNISGNRLNFTDANGHYAQLYCASGIPPDVSEGDVIRASGHAFPSGNPLIRQSFYAKKIELVEHRDPAPYADTVKLTGTVAGVVDKDPEWYWLVLRTAEGLKGVVAKSKHYPFARLQSLVDAEVEVEGVPYCTIGLYGAVVPHFSIRGKNSIRVLKNAPDSPFDAPPFSKINLPHRQVLSGMVIGTTSDRFALLCQLNFTVVVHLGEGQKPPRPYETVEASGFVSSAPNIIMDNAVYRNVALQREEGPLPNPSLTNDAAKVKARVIGRSIADWRMFVAEGGRSFAVDLSALRDKLSGLPEIDSVIEVGGYRFHEVAGASNLEVFPRLVGLTIAPRTLEEFKVIKGPPWWTPLRATLTIATLLAIFSAFHSINRARLKAKIAERTRLATELHDYLAQDLTAISYQLTAAKCAQQSNKNAMQPLNAADHMLSSCRAELRRCLYDLRNAALDESNFKRAVEITLRPIVKGIKCNVTMQFSRLPFNDTSTHIILSILRELSSNAVSHGKATILSISGVIKSHRLIFTVRDNGCGFDPSSAPALDDGHFGLEGIRMRLRQLSGMIEISSAPNEGTVITLSLPV